MQEIDGIDYEIIEEINKNFKKLIEIDIMLIDNAVNNSVFDCGEFSSDFKNVQMINKKVKLADGAMISHEDVTNDLSSIIAKIPDEKMQKLCINTIQNELPEHIDNHLYSIINNSKNDSYYDKVLKVKRLLSFSNNMFFSSKEPFPFIQFGGTTTEKFADYYSNELADKKGHNYGEVLENIENNAKLSHMTVAEITKDIESENKLKDLYEKILESLAKNMKENILIIIEDNLNRKNFDYNSLTKVYKEQLDIGESFKDLSSICGKLNDVFVLLSASKSNTDSVKFIDNILNDIKTSVVDSSIGLIESNFENRKPKKEDINFLAKISASVNIIASSIKLNGVLSSEHITNVLPNEEVRNFYLNNLNEINKREVSFLTDGLSRAEKISNIKRFFSKKPKELS